MTFDPPYRALTLIVRFRRLFRASEAGFIGLAIAIGVLAGLLAVALGSIARTLQHVLFTLPAGDRLSGLARLSAAQLWMLPLGGAVLVLFSLVTRARRRAMVDAVEANALHGGAMSVSDSLVISGQTVISNGFGASVGLEAGYAQLGSAVASIAGRALKLRRSDLRILVGAGAGAGIAAAFGAPLAGAFYAFEIVIGAYTPSAIAPVAAAALAGTITAQALGITPYLISTTAGTMAVPAAHYLLYALLGGICAAIGIVIMRLVALVESETRRLPARIGWLRPVIGGALLVPIAMLSPQVLSSGHEALHIDLTIGYSLSFIAVLFIAKASASIVSLGFGFRGGLFFASLFLGTLIGHLFAGGLALAAGFPVVSENDAALVGMAALAVAIVGGPMTMAMLVLQATHDFSLTGAVVAAALIASTIVREGFGYSFSTWRLHLRGETIKSARDVGWVRSLTAGRMMRRETRATPADLKIEEFRRRFPLGSASRVVLVDTEGGYVGIADPASAFAEGVDAAARIDTLARNRDAALTPELDIVAIMARFDAAQTDELAVLNPDAKVIGVLSESFVRRRYTEELEKAQRDLFRER